MNPDLPDLLQMNLQPMIVQVVPHNDPHATYLFLDERGGFQLGTIYRDPDDGKLKMFLQFIPTKVT